jgi:hypothetical protein
VADDLERRIDAIYDAPLDAFIGERDALAKALAADGDTAASKRVKALRKPVVPAWVVNRLARERADEIGALVDLGERLRSAQRRALSGGDVDALREALDERRRLVAALTRDAVAILEREGAGAGARQDEITATLEAAAADEEAGALVRSGRLTKPLRPPSSFGEGGLRVLEGGRAPAARAAPTRTPTEARLSKRDEDRARREQDRARRDEERRLAKALTEAEARERKAGDAVERARAALEEADRRRAEAKERLRAAEADLRGATLERKRAASRTPS